MDQYLGRFGMSAMAFVPMRGEEGTVGVLGMGRGPGRPAYTTEEVEAAQRIADAAAELDGEPGALLTLLLIDGAIGSGAQAERRFAHLVERLPAIVYEAEPGAEGLWLYVSGFVETLLGYTPEEWRADPALWARSLHDDDRDAVLAAEERLTAGERIAIEYRMHASGDEADAVAGELVGTLRGQSFTAGGETVRVTASAGLAALDRDGAGLGSFSSLRALPIDYLKIDGEFVRGIARSPVDREIVKAIVALARAAGRRTIAEFVADQETLDLLTEIGVDLAQGFHIGRPRPLEELL